MKRLVIISGIDTGVPMLHYGQARVVAFGIKNVKFMQLNAEDTGFETETFDWIQTTMFLHETSMKAMFKIGEEIFRMLKPNGLSLHIEQPQYSDKMPLFEQFIRDWDAFNNNEPFWGASEVAVLNERLDTIERLFSCKISFIRFKLRFLYLILNKRKKVNAGTHYTLQEY